MSWVERDAQDYTDDHDYGTDRRNHRYGVCLNCGKQIYSAYQGPWEHTNSTAGRVPMEKMCGTGFPGKQAELKPGAMAW